LWTELMSWLSGVREGYYTCRQPIICPAQAAAIELDCALYMG